MMITQLTPLQRNLLEPPGRARHLERQQFWYSQMAQPGGDAIEPLAGTEETPRSIESRII
jgi:hypothetical protein